MPADFIPGLDLAEGFYRDAVLPILQSDFPGLKHSAALIGPGSEVLGFDSEMSTDHSWGPRAQLFLEGKDFEELGGKIRRALGLRLPAVYRGFPTRFSEPDPSDKGVKRLDPQSSGAVGHGVDILRIDQFFQDYLGIDIEGDLSASKWLVLPSQKLRSVVAGRVFRDELGLQGLRDRLEWYPHDVWLYIMGSCWKRIGQEEHLMGRAGIAGDEIGSSLIGSRIVRDLMRLAFYQERVYPPYAKWFGTAFRQLKCASDLEPLLAGALHSTSWRQREKSLAPAMEALVGRHNELGLADEQPARVRGFWNRPFKIIGGEGIAASIGRRIADPRLKRLSMERPIGSLDIFSDSTDMIENGSLAGALEGLYRDGD